MFGTLYLGRSASGERFSAALSSSFAASHRRQRHTRSRVSFALLEARVVWSRLQEGEAFTRVQPSSSSAFLYSLCSDCFEAVYFLSISHLRNSGGGPAVPPPCAACVIAPRKALGDIPYIPRSPLCQHSATQAGRPCVKTALSSRGGREANRLETTS